MSEATAEKIGSRVVEPLDILSGNLKFHWTEVEKLPRILSKGFYSESFAKQIKDNEFKPLHQSLDKGARRYTHVADTVYPQIWELDMGKGVALAVNVPQDRNIFFRVAPRNFLGLVIYDEEYDKGIDLITEESIQRRVDQIAKILDEQGKTLPIYGTSGNMYWPKQMSHEEIVRMMPERQESKRD